MIASAPVALQVAPAKGPLPVATPHLMPFHIAYSGPAPISTYFRVHRAPPPTFGRDTPSEIPQTAPSESQESSDSQATLVATPEAVQPGSSLTVSSALNTVDTDMQDPATASTSSSTLNGRHFTAAFRGRSMHGLEVDLPEGYAGVVLRAPEGLKGKSTADEQRTKARTKAKGGTRASQRSRHAQEAVEDMGEDEAALEGQDDGPVRTLTPVAQFSSFVLWHPDVPVDEGRDEYLRSLTEWTKLAAEIHRTEDC